MNEQVLTQQAHASTVEADVSQTFTLELEENPTTGYLWHLKTAPGLDVVSQEYTPRSEAAVGGGGQRRFRLHVARPGESQVHASLYRPWLGEGSAIQHCDFTIRAR